MSIWQAAVQSHQGTPKDTTLLPAECLNSCVQITGRKQYLVLVEVLQVLSFLLFCQLAPHPADGRAELADGQMRIPRLHLKPHLHQATHFSITVQVVKKGKGFSYSIRSVGPGAEPGVQAVSLQ